MKRHAYRTASRKVHLQALAVCTLLLATTSSAVAWMSSPVAAPPEAACDAPLIGRFVVSPGDAYFVAGRDTPVVR